LSISTYSLLTQQTQTTKIIGYLHLQYGLAGLSSETRTQAMIAIMSDLSLN